jgi:hypothetical protein
MLHIKEPDGTIAVYDERGILENHFATRQEAQAWVDYRNREDAASLEIAERTKERARQLIAEWSAEAAAEFNLELKDVRLDIRWAIEDVLEEMCPE